MLAWQWTPRLHGFREPFSRLRIEKPPNPLTDTKFIDPCKHSRPDPLCNAYLSWFWTAMRVESPDLVVFGGDNVWGQGNLQAKRILRQLVSPMQNVPIVLTTGNHDQRGRLSLHQIRGPQACPRSEDVLIDLTLGDEVYLQLYAFTYRQYVAAPAKPNPRW